MTDSATVQLWAPPSQGLNTALITHLIPVASAMVEQLTRRVWIAEQVANEQHSGDRAEGADKDKLYLQRYPVKLPSGPSYPITITENGVALTYTTDSQDTSKDCLLLPALGILIRRNKSWAAGTGNVLVTYTGGYLLAELPQDLKQLTSELVWLIYRESRRQGMPAQSAKGASASYLAQLAGYWKHIVNARTDWLRPVTVEGWQGTWT